LLLSPTGTGTVANSMSCDGQSKDLRLALQGWFMVGRCLGWLVREQGRARPGIPRPPRTRRGKLNPSDAGSTAAGTRRNWTLRARVGKSGWGLRPRPCQVSGKHMAITPALLSMTPKSFRQRAAAQTKRARALSPRHTITDSPKRKEKPNQKH